MPAFLFTDLESSTRLWEERPEEMTDALARHDQILRDAVGSVGGMVVKSTGDGMLASFDSATDALAAGLRAQLDLGAEPWPGEPLRVRMGAHVGEGEARDGDVFGRDINRAARIMAAGHGGQLLVSAAMAEHARLPDGVALRDLGVHRLRDLTEPERLHQVIHSALPDDFPPPATLDAVPNNLPMQLSEFLGREQELATISAMLTAPGTRLLTLTGPGGAGKTRLSLQTAADLLDDFRHGCFFVDLSSTTEPDAAFEAIVLALDLPQATGGSPLRILETRLRDRERLLVLDNLEQVTEIAGGLAQLLGRCPELKILATSRESLRIRGEQVFPVPPLELPHPMADVAVIAEAEAVKLFVDRARSIRADFALDEDNAGVVAEICLRLDGLPLAIELAAARLNVFSAADLADRLRGRLNVLVSSHRDLPDRQRTLWGAIGWSYELLDPVECRLFEMMSVFAPTELGPLEAVAAATIGDAMILDALASLVDKSLVRSQVVDGSQRFSMLHTIREYAAERLQASERVEAVRRAHAEVFSSQLSATGETRDLENLRIAWSFWVADQAVDRVLEMHDRLWSAYGGLGSNLAAIALDDEALALLSSTGEGHTKRELHVLARRARMLMAVHGYTAAVDAAYREIVAVAVDATPEQRSAILVPIGVYLITTSDFGATVEVGNEILADAEATGDMQGLIDGHYTIGIGLAFGTDPIGGLVHIDRAIELWDVAARSGDQPRAGASMGVAARVAAGLLRWSFGEPRRAVRLLSEALALARQLGQPMSIAHATWHNGLLALERQRYDDALAHARELAEISAGGEFPVWETLAMVLEGVSVAALGDPAAGVDLTEAGVVLYQGLTVPPIFWPDLLRLRATVFVRLGDGERALTLLDEAEAIVGSDATPPDHLVVRGDAVLATPEPDRRRALGIFEEAARRARMGGARGLELVAATRVVELRRQLGVEDDGSQDLREVLSAFDEDLDEVPLAAAARLLAVSPGTA